MISIDDHPPPDPSSSDYHNHQQQVSHDLKINSSERAPASGSDIDLLKPTDVINLDDTNNRLRNFSIRDYVFGSRCKDNITCNWPFSNESLQVCLEYGLKNFLPPFESLDSLRSNSSVSNEEKIITSFNVKSKDDHRFVSQSHVEEEDLAQTKPHKSHHPTSSQTPAVNFIVSEIAMASKVCPVCKTFSSSSNTTLNAHIDRCLSLSEESKSNMKRSANPSKMIVKHRIKPRKTRLMVEIYKNAPRCTVEELDRRNGTSWATNSSFPNQEFEFQDHEGIVYIDTNGTKLRILSMPEVCTLDDDEARKLQKGSKIVMEKKKKKVYVHKKKLSSLKPHHGFCKVRSGQEENVAIERSCKKEDRGEKATIKAKVHKQMNSLAITRNVAKKFNGKNGILHSGSGTTNEFLVESDKSSSQYSKKARTQLTHGIKVASLKSNLLSATQENNSGSKISLKRKSSALKKSNENDDPFQDSLKYKSRMEEEEEEEDTSKNSSFEIENVVEVNKKKSINTSKSSDGDSLESTRTEEIPSHLIHFQGSFMGLRNSIDDDFSKLISQPNNKFDLQENITIGEENYFQEVDPIPIPGPPGSFLPPSPGGDIISEELQVNSCLTTTSRVQSTEDHHHHQHDHMMNRDFMSESPISTISSPSFARSIKSTSAFQNYHPCCCSRKEAVFSKNIASYPRESVVLRETMSRPETVKSIKFPVYRDCESAVISPSAAPVLRLMGKNLTVVKTDDHIEQFKTPSCSSLMSHHHQLHNIQNDKNSFFHGFPSQHQNGSIPQHINVHPPNNSRNLADLKHIHPFDTMLPSRNGLIMVPLKANKEMITIDDSSGNEADDSYLRGVSPVFCNGSFQTLSPFNEDLGRWGCT